MTASLQIRLLGVRGSVPVHGPAFARFGGATSCVFCLAGKEAILLDAGSGLLWEELPQVLPEKRFSVLLTHAHVDHILGFPMFAPLFDKTYECDVYLKDRQGRSAKERVEALMAPPLWPVGPAALQAAIRFQDVPSAFCIGDVQVRTMEAIHPGGATIFKLTRGEASLVYATDFEPDPERTEAFCTFAQGCSLLLLDAQYTREEYTSTKGFGHMPMDQAAELATACGAKKTLFVHHAPGRTDQQLLALERQVQSKYPNIAFGRAGEALCL